MEIKSQQDFLDQRTFLERVRHSSMENGTWTSGDENWYIDSRMRIKGAEELHARLRAGRTIWALGPTHPIIGLITDTMTELDDIFGSSNWGGYDCATFSLFKTVPMKTNAQCICPALDTDDDQGRFFYFLNGEEVNYDAFEAYRAAFTDGFNACAPRKVDPGTTEWEILHAKYVNGVNATMRVVDTKRLCHLCHQNAIGNWITAKFVWKGENLFIDWPEVLGSRTVSNKDISQPMYLALCKDLYEAIDELRREKTQQDEAGDNDETYCCTGVDVHEGPMAVMINLTPEDVTALQAFLQGKPDGTAVEIPQCGGTARLTLEDANAIAAALREDATPEMIERGDQIVLKDAPAPAPPQPTDEHKKVASEAGLCPNCPDNAKCFPEQG